MPTFSYAPSLQVVSPATNSETITVEAQSLSNKLGSLLAMCKNQATQSRRAAASAEKNLDERRRALSHLSDDLHRRIRSCKLSRGWKRTSRVDACPRRIDGRCHRDRTRCAIDKEIIRTPRTNIKESTDCETDDNLEPGMIDLCFDVVD